MAKQDENRRISVWSKAWWTVQDPWPYLKRTAVVFVILMVLSYVLGHVF